MKIVVATAWNDLYQPLADISVPLMKAYCQKHGYHFAEGKGLYHTNELDLLTYGDRVKIHMYKQLYSSYDAYVWIDVDTLIMNSEQAVWTPENAVLWTYDPTGPVSGYFFARCTPSPHLFLHQAQHKSVEMKDDLQPCGRAIQDAMRILMHIPPFDGYQHCVAAKDVGHCYFSYGYYGWDMYKDIGEYAKGDWLVTFPAVPLEQRIELMRQWSQDAT